MYQKYLIDELYFGYVMVNFKDSNNNYLYFTLLRKVEKENVYFDLIYPNREISNHPLEDSISFIPYNIEPLSNYSNNNIVSKRQASIIINELECEFSQKVLKKN